MTTEKKYTASIAGETFEVKPFADKYLMSLFELVREFRDPSVDHYAIMMIKKVAIPNLPESIAVSDNNADDPWYMWSAMLDTQEIIAFACDIIIAQQKYVLNSLSQKKHLDIFDKNRITTVTNTIKAIEASGSSALKEKRMRLLPATETINTVATSVVDSDIPEGQAFIDSLTK